MEAFSDRLAVDFQFIFLIFVLLAEHSNYFIPLCDTMLSFVDCVTRLVFLSDTCTANSVSACQ